MLLSCEVDQKIMVFTVVALRGDPRDISALYLLPLHWLGKDLGAKVRKFFSIGRRL